MAGRVCKPDCPIGGGRPGIVCSICVPQPDIVCQGYEFTPEPRITLARIWKQFKADCCRWLS